MFVVKDMTRFLRGVSTHLVPRLGYRFSNHATVKGDVDVVLHDEYRIDGGFTESDWYYLWNIVSQSDGMVVLAQPTGAALPRPSEHGSESISAVTLFFTVGSTLCCYDIVDQAEFAERTGELV